MQKDLLADIEFDRGDMPRSRYIREKLEEALREEK